jgi:hypothetical protein
VGIDLVLEGLGGFLKGFGLFIEVVVLESFDRLC